MRRPVPALRYRDPVAFFGALREKSREGARSQFQEIVAAIASAEARRLGATAEVPGNPDSGIDVLVTAPSGAVTVWQSKYTQHPKHLVAEAKKSLKSLARRNLANIERWKLAAPFDVSRPTRDKIERAVHAALGASVVFEVVGATDLKESTLLLGLSFCREYFGARVFPRRIKPWVAGGVATILVVSAAYALHLSGIVAGLRGVRADFSPPDVEPLLRVKVPHGGAAQLRRQLQSIVGLGYVDDGQLQRTKSLMGEAWTKTMKGLQDPLRSYRNSPSGRKCQDFIRALEELRTSSAARGLIGLWTHRRQLASDVRHYGLVCQIVATGDLRPAMLASVLAAYDRERCTMPLGRELRCSGPSAATVLGRGGWADLDRWLGLPDAMAARSNIGRVILGACDETIRDLELLGPHGGLRLLADVDLSGNSPVNHACILLGWHSLPVSGGTPSEALESRRMFGFALVEDGSVVAFRRDGQASTFRRVSDPHYLGSLRVDAWFSFTEPTLKLNMKATDPSPAHRLRGRLTSYLMPSASASGDGKSSCFCQDCSSTEGIWDPDTHQLHFVPAGPPVGPPGPHLWGGTEDAITRITVGSQRATFSGKSGPGQLPEQSVSSGTPVRVVARPVGVSGDGVLSYLVRGNHGCVVEVRRMLRSMTTQGLAVDEKWTRQYVMSRMDTPVLLTPRCPNGGLVNFAGMQWEPDRQFPSGVLGASPVGHRRCRRPWSLLVGGGPGESSPKALPALLPVAAAAHAN